MHCNLNQGIDETYGRWLRPPTGEPVGEQQLDWKIKKLVQSSNPNNPLLSRR